MLLITSQLFKKVLFKIPIFPIRMAKVNTRISLRRNINNYSKRWNTKKPKMKNNKLKEDRTLIIQWTESGRKSRKAMKKKLKRQSWSSMKNMDIKLSLKCFNGSKRLSNRIYWCSMSLSTGNHWKIQSKKSSWEMGLLKLLYGLPMM